MFTIWTTILNLVLLVICNTSILNPGPDKNNNFSHLKVMYQNLRGLVPFSGLVSKNMPLDAGKLLELQSKIYEDKPDVIVLTETWLSKEHLENEILPDSIYKIYRKDKSKRSHPRILITQISFEGRGVESLLQSRLASVLKMTRLMSALGLK